MLTVNGLHRFYFLPHFHDMRCKASRILEIIRNTCSRDPMNGDVFIFMSKRYDKIKMVHFEKHAYYLHEKSYVNGYRFMKVRTEDGRRLYSIEWRNLVAILETPMIKEIRLS